MPDWLITALVIAVLAVCALAAVGLLMMWCALVFRAVRWLLPRAPAAPPERATD